MALGRSFPFFLALLSLVGLLWLGQVEASYAQGSDRANPVLESEACREDPNSEECVCEHLMDLEAGGLAAVEDPLLEYRMDSLEEARDEGRDFVKTRKYRYLCSVTYLHEDMRRGWNFLVLLAAGLATVSIVWCGFVYAQETASGEQRASARLVIIRVIIGLLLVVLAYAVWDVVNGFFFAGGDGWSLDGDIFFDLDALRGGGRGEGFWEEWNSW